jgi:hypothetical protein
MTYYDTQVGRNEVCKENECKLPYGGICDKNAKSQPKPEGSKIIVAHKSMTW